MKRVLSIIVCTLLAATYANAYFFFYGGPVNDIGKNGFIYPSLKADQRNLENALGKILIEQIQIKQCIATIQKTFGGRTSVTLVQGGRRSTDTTAATQSLMVELAAIKQKDPNNAVCVAVLERQVTNLSALSAFEDKLASMDAKSRQPMTFVERQGLQQELNVLNAEIFTAEAVNRATIEADQAAAEARKTELREMQQIRSGIRDSIGQK